LNLAQVDSAFFDPHHVSLSELMFAESHLQAYWLAEHNWDEYSFVEEQLVSVSVSATQRYHGLSLTAALCCHWSVE
jgi:hypothetical protein